MPEFDDFYHAARKDLLLQTFALTGDLTASRAAVQDAFVASRQHWRKVRHLDDPIQWVRPRAWSIAQRRSVGRIWHRVKDATEDQKELLKALSDLPETQRKILLLTQLTHTAPSVVGREVGVTAARMAAELEQATTALTQSLSCEPVELPGRLHGLDPLLARHGLPRASAIRRQGQLRQRRHVIVSIAAALGLIVVSGWFVSRHEATEAVAAQPARPITRAMLLDAATTQSVLSPAKPWVAGATGHNTDGDGIHTVCQQARYADSDGVGAWVRSLRTAQGSDMSSVQAVEVSSTPGAAKSAFDTAQNWYAGCTEAGVRLSRAFTVEGVGDQAAAYKLRVPSAPSGSYYVMLARAGSTLTTLSVMRKSNQPQPVDSVARLLGLSVDRLCKTDALPKCATQSAPTVRPILAPPSGEGAGMVATADLPIVQGIANAWVGTPVEKASRNVAATICDDSNFAKMGAVAQRTRTFLIPQAKVPTRFGLTEIQASFSTPQQARKSFDSIRTKMASCEERQPGSQVGAPEEQLKGYRGSAFAMWRVSNEINQDNATVAYWMGIAVVGNHLAQVNFTPTDKHDVSADAFRDLMARGRDRLFELPDGAPTPSGSPTSSPTVAKP